MKLYKLNHDY